MANTRATRSTRRSAAAGVLPQKRVEDEEHNESPQAKKSKAAKRRESLSRYVHIMYVLLCWVYYCVHTSDNISINYIEQRNGPPTVSARTNRYPLRLLKRLQKRYRILVLVRMMRNVM